MTTTQTAASTTFIDLATFSELEGFIYGGPNAITWFVASIQKSNWFSFIPISLRHTGTPEFGARNIAAHVNRSGDYVLSVWFRAQIPKIALNGNINATARLSWTRNLMHNLIEKVQIMFNELVVEEFDNFWLDFNYVFRIPGSKKMGYRNLIGDISAMTTPVPPGTALGTGGYFSVPLPFWFSEDSGLALPVAALPFNDIKINYTFRPWQHLVLVYPGIGGLPASTANVNMVAPDGTITTQPPTLGDPQTFAHYVVVHNDERVKMGDAPRDMLIRQVQETQFAPFRDPTSNNSFDIRLSHAIINFFFAAENDSLLKLNRNLGREGSNYTTKSAVTDPPTNGIYGSDPIAFAQLIYESTVRVSMGSDYYSLMVPYLLSDAVPGVPEETGMHMYTYALLPWDPIKPSGTTNYSKLANVSMVYNMSTAAVNASLALPVDESGVAITIGGPQSFFPQSWRHIFVAQNHNIARVANGSLGHPTL